MSISDKRYEQLFIRLTWVLMAWLIAMPGAFAIWFPVGVVCAAGTGFTFTCIVILSIEWWRQLP